MAELAQEVLTKDVHKKEAAAGDGTERTRATKIYTPLVDIVERPDDILVIADMPGADENSVDVTLEKNVLTIYGRVEPVVPADHRLAYAEYGIGDYERSFTLSDQVDGDKIEASMKDGVLRLVLPKSEKARLRKIMVKSAA